jgi:CcmD family protein
MADVWYLALAYGIIWLGLFGYLFRLSRQARDLGQELNVLREVLAAEGRDEPRWDGAPEFDESPQAVMDERPVGSRAAPGEAQP